MASFTDIAISSILSCLALLLWLRHKNKYPSPPGPPADPIIGHWRKFPSQNVPKVFMEWAQTYGDVMFMGSFGRKIIILNSMEAANDLFDDRSAIYSCRDPTAFFKLMELPPNLPFLPYGKGFFKQRRLFNQYLSHRKSDSYRPIQLRQAHVLVNELLDSGAENYDQTLSRFATSILVKVAFGYEIASNDDPFMAILDRFSNALAKDGPAGVTAIDALPFLVRFPSWFPGTYYANWAKNIMKPLGQQMQEYPITILKQHIAEGHPDACILSAELEKTVDSDSGSEHLQDLKGVAVAMYLAGASTTKRTIEIFLLAMLLHPECQRRCQEELDRVIGTDRLPEFEDRKSLPYLECVWQETLRWNPVVPLGVPHRSTDDDIYKGMFIPKNSKVIPNIYGMTHDESRYLDPDNFNPSRFMPKSEGGGEETFYPVNFGWGRRICPGRFLAENSTWIAMATMLATFNLNRAIGQDGKEITPKEEFSSSLVRRVKSLQFCVEPRSVKAEELCRREKE
ncbi:cytochrome P450 [Mycena floridula]|nr:cytochrome P450 [Mycena floridula]